MPNEVQKVQPEVIKLPAFSKEIAINAEWIERRNQAVAEAQKFAKVTSLSDYQAATVALGAVTRLDSGIEKMRKELTAPFLSAQRIIKEKVDAYCLPLIAEKERLKKIAGEWYEGEQKRIRAEAAERELRDREAAEEEAARQKMEREQADALGLEAPAPVDIPEVITPVEVAPKSLEASVTMVVGFEVVNEDRIPRNFLMFDPRKVNEYIRQNKADIQKKVEEGNADSIIPGIKFTSRPDIRSR